jgi:hypothetical protein
MSAYGRQLRRPQLSTSVPQTVSRISCWHVRQLYTRICVSLLSGNGSMLAICSSLPQRHLGNSAKPGTDDRSNADIGHLIESGNQVHAAATHKSNFRSKDTDLSGSGVQRCDRAQVRHRDTDQPSTTRPEGGRQFISVLLKVTSEQYRSVNDRIKDQHACQRGRIDRGTKEAP